MEVCLKAAIAQKKADMTFVSGDQVQDVTDMLERVFDNLPEPAHNQSNNSHDHAAEDPFTGPRSHQQSKLSSLQLTGLFRNEASLETPSCESGDASSIFYLLIEEATSLPKVAGKMPHPCMVVRSLGQEVCALRHIRCADEIMYSLEILDCRAVVFQFCLVGRRWLPMLSAVPLCLLFDLLFAFSLLLWDFLYQIWVSPQCRM